MTDDLRGRVRAAISNAYYDARNGGQTMETAADSAADAVMHQLTLIPEPDNHHNAALCPYCTHRPDLINPEDSAFREGQLRQAEIRRERGEQ